MQNVENKISNKKIIALIPARLSSSRVKAKNLRLLNGKPLVYYAIDACKGVKYFTDVYVNSESDLIGQVAEEYGVKYYKRPEELSADNSMIDDYLYEFLKNVDCDVLVVVNPTSPFIKAAEIESALENFMEHGFDTQLGYQNIRTHLFYNNEPLNFSLDNKHPRSQDVNPAQALNFAVSIWDSISFINHYERNGHAVYNGNLGFFPFEGLSAIEIDWPEDCVLAEIIMENQERFVNESPSWSHPPEKIFNNQADLKN